MHMGMLQTQIDVLTTPLDAKKLYYVMPQTPKLANFGEFSSVLETPIFGVYEIVVLTYGRHARSICSTFGLLYRYGVCCNVL